MLVPRENTAAPHGVTAAWLEEPRRKNAAETLCGARTDAQGPEAGGRGVQSLPRMQFLGLALDDKRGQGASRTTEVRGF